jgi:hypothetical protein
MSGRLVCAAVLTLLVLAPVARADGPQASPGLIQGWTGVTAPGFPFRYVTMPSGSSTVLAQVRRSSGRVWGFRSFAGFWGVPQVANDGTAGGLNRDRKVVVLAAWDPRGHLRSTSRFLLVSTRSFRVWRRVTLKGDFAFDAISPGARTLYLIEHVSATDLTRYRVRAYDLATRRLLPRAIADRRQAGWTMQGYPVACRQPGCAVGLHALPAARRVAVRARARRCDPDGRLRRDPLARSPGHPLVGAPARRPACTAAAPRDPSRAHVVRNRYAHVLGLSAGGDPARRLPGYGASPAVTGGSADHGKTTQRSVRRQTYSAATIERGFS